MEDQGRRGTWNRDRKGGGERKVLKTGDNGERLGQEAGGRKKNRGRKKLYRRNNWGGGGLQGEKTNKRGREERRGMQGGKYILPQRSRIPGQGGSRTGEGVSCNFFTA
jgi:hypothetical protein